MEVSAAKAIGFVVFCILIYAAIELRKRHNKFKQDGLPKGPTKNHPTK